ncbi:MAG: hypothetical protein AB7G06_04170 [Bdellovibrionales bacterium]
MLESRYEVDDNGILYRRSEYEPGLWNPAMRDHTIVTTTVRGAMVGAVAGLAGAGYFVVTVGTFAAGMALTGGVAGGLALGVALGLALKKSRKGQAFPYDFDRQERASASGKRWNAPHKVTGEIIESDVVLPEMRTIGYSPAPH